MAERAPPPAESEPRGPPRRLRRPPARQPPRGGDVYVNLKTDFRAQLGRCQKLLAPGTGCGELRLHGLGLAIHRAIHLALQLEASAGGALRLAANTGTVQLAQAAQEPEGDSDEPGPARPRNNSAIHIRVLRAAPE